MAGADACAVISMEVLEEKDVVPPVGVDLEDLGVAVDGAAAAVIAFEDRDHSSRNLGGDFPEVQLLTRAGGALHREVVAEPVVVLLQRLDEQIVDGKPDRTAPVGIAAEIARQRLRRGVIEAVGLRIDLLPVDVRAGVVLRVKE